MSADCRDEGVGPTACLSNERSIASVTFPRACRDTYSATAALNNSFRERRLLRARWSIFLTSESGNAIEILMSSAEWRRLRSPIEVNPRPTVQGFEFEL